MNMRSTVYVKGAALIRVKREGRLVRSFRVRNLVVNAGLILLAQIISTAGATKPSHMAVGSSNAVTTLAMTDLQGTEHERVAVTESRVDQSIKYSATFGSGIASSVQAGEFGIFNGTPTGTMLARFITPTFTIGAGDTVEVDWTITLV